ncbi:MAG: hypothetical protein LBL58_14585, partial [Tannerellaceae bacterium]|jgi:hypothetical protein|nr:hypothetical protein [Tannerellaceae bacterium]
MAFGTQGTDFLCIDDLRAIETLNSKYKYFYLPDGRVVDLGGKYQASGFFTEKDPTETARGSLAALRMDETNIIHTFYSNSQKTAGYGTVKIDDIVTTAHDAEAVRIVISEDRKSITVRRNNQDIESISIDGTCPCEASTSFKEVYFATSRIAQAYVDYFAKNSRQVANDIHTDNDIISGLSNQVVTRKTESYKDLFGEVLADRLLMYEKANGRKFVVIMQEVNLLSVNQTSWNELAKNVFAASGLGSNDILITLPYVTCPGIGFDSGNIFYMPGLAFGNNSKIDLSALGKDYGNTQRTAELQAGVQPSSLWKFILDVFTYTQKQYYQRYYYIDFRGDITGRTSEEMNHSGYAGTYDYQLSLDQRFERYAEVLKISQQYLDRNDRSITQYQIDAFTRAREEAEKEYNHFASIHPIPSDIPVVHGMNEAEGVSTVEHCEQYARWYRDRIFAADGKATASPPDNHFYGGKNQVLYNETKAQIDALGIILMPINFDWIADAIGFFHSGYYADYTNSSLYASCLIIPAVSASAIKVTGDLVKGLKNGTHHIVQEQEQGQYVIRAIDDVVDGSKAVKTSLLAKLGNDFPNLKNWVTSLDEIVDTGLLSRLDELDNTYLAKLNTDIQHPTYGPEIKEILKENPDDLVTVWKQVNDDPALSWELSKENPLWEKWNQRAFFKDRTGKGKSFEETVCLNAFKNRASKEYQQLKQQFTNDFGKNLDDYDMYSQVQLYYNGDDYFIADQIFVKYTTNQAGRKVIDDILVLENKLSGGTPLTSPQNGALKNNSYKVRNQKKIYSEYGTMNELKYGEELKFSSNIQWYKVHDGSSDGKVIEGIFSIK